MVRISLSIALYSLRLHAEGSQVHVEAYAQDYTGYCDEIIQKTVACYVFCVLFSAIILKMGSCLPSQLNGAPVDGAAAVCSTCHFESWAEICPQ